MPRPCFRLTPLALAAALALPSLVFIVSPAHAQTSTAMPISLPAQSLGTALNELARQARLQLMVHPDLVADKQAPAVSGSLTPRQALDRVLAGSGLVADIQGTEVIIRRMPAAESGVTTLVEMKVTAQGMDDGTTEGTGSYTTRSMGTATGLVLSPRETPQSVSVITHQRIEDQRLVSVAEALRNAPGVSYKAIDRGRGGTTVRGFSLTNFQIDGVPTILDANMDIDNASIAIYDRIEVVRGATGLRSGGDYQPRAQACKQQGVHRQSHVGGRFLEPLRRHGRPHRTAEYRRFGACPRGGQLPRSGRLYRFRADSNYGVLRHCRC